jgi:predicted cupin superfamily sugar epimerase
MTADEIVKWLDLKPHPEGGYYRETFRDSAAVDGRAHSTAIYCLLRAARSAPASSRCARDLALVCGRLA